MRARISSACARPAPPGSAPARPQRVPSFSSTRKVRHGAIQMFELVADVEQYPKFVPLCEALRIKRRMQSDDGLEVLVADMTVAYKVIRETFTSRVTLDRAGLAIQVQYLDGPFSRLDNRWTFADLGLGSSEVTFFISYEFRSRALSLLMGAMFDAAFHRFAGAFEARADEVYGLHG